MLGTKEHIYVDNTVMLLNEHFGCRIVVMFYHNSIMCIPFYLNN